ncbi:MAG: ATP-binding protein [Myxococcales bacterium]|nr:ATP-binding protein [Myxococcales bacterium]
MSLGKKIIVFLVAVLAMCMLLISAALVRFVNPRFEAVDRRAAENTLERVESALDALLMHIDAINHDWAEWNDLRSYVQGEQSDFAERNLYDYSFFEMDLNLILLFDAEGKLFWGQFLDTAANATRPLEDLLIEPFAPDGIVVRQASRATAVRGVLRTRRGPMLVVSRAILTEKGEGPSAGALVFGHLLDAPQQRALARQVDAVVSFVPIEGRSGAESPGRGAAAGSHQERRGNRQIVDTEIEDIYGEPAYRLEVEMSRETASVGLDAVRFALLLGALTAFVPVVSMWLFSRWLLVVPISRLTRHIHALRESRDLSRRLELRRADEIGTLAEQFDALTSELEQARFEMAEARDAALEMARVKSEFLATMSHEIRTPMHGVIGAMEILEGMGLSAEQQRLAATVQSSADGLLSIIDDILDFSKLEADAVVLESRDFSLRQLVDNAVNTFAGSAETRGIALDCDVIPEIDAVFVGDPHRLRQILLNLIGNAVKFTEAGGVRVEVTAEACDAARCRVRFAVRDTGIGIPPEKQAEVFSSFSQADASTTRAYGGTGLGLAICRRLVQLMGGEIGLESEAGVGSTFWFSVPLERGSSERVPSARVVRQRLAPLGARVLLVEDNRVNQQVAAAMLERIGCRFEAASNGLEALDALAASRYDLVLMDCQMPVLDGFAATAAIRRREAEAGGGERIPIVALTANAVEGDRERCVASGMDDYLSKPFRLEALHALLARWLGEPGEAQAPRPELPAERREEAAGEPARRSAEAPPLDAAVLESLRGILGARGERGLADLFAVYRSSAVEQMEDLARAVEAGDAEGINACAHALKSSSRNVGASALGELFAELEVMGRGGDLAHAKSVFARAEAEFARVLDALARAA